MQTIDRDGRYVAEWGRFTVILDQRSRRCLAEIRAREDGQLVAAMPDLPNRTSREAIEWAAEQLLAAGGGYVFVDGNQRPLADFLRFEMTSQR